MPRHWSGNVESSGRKKLETESTKPSTFPGGKQEQPEEETDSEQ